jgi:hypothetical protein
MVATGYLAYSFSVSMCHFETLHSPGNCKKALHLCIYEYGNLGINKLVASVHTPICWIRDWFSNFNPTPLISFDLLEFSIFGLAGKQHHSSEMLVGGGR